MGQADYDYGVSSSLNGVGATATDPCVRERHFSLSVSIFADRDTVLKTLADDVRAAGLDLRGVQALSVLLNGDPCPIGDIVVVDCPSVGGSDCAALARLDIRVKRAGAHLIVSTCVESLDTVFCCLDQSRPQILVDPTRGERVIALGRALARIPPMRLRDISEDDRLTLLRLTEQVGQIAERLDAMGGADGELRRSASAFRFGAPSREFRNEPPGNTAGKPGRAARPPLPDPRLVRRIIEARKLREAHFDSALFADPAWDILLDLTAARAEHKRVSVSSLCIASGVPPTTALRWIGQMIDSGLLKRVDDDTDRRRAFISLTDSAADAMARYFTALATEDVTPL